jgi:hypothetical protein
MIRCLATPIPPRSSAFCQIGESDQGRFSSISGECRWRWRGLPSKDFDAAQVDPVWEAPPSDDPRFLAVKGGTGAAEAACPEEQILLKALDQLAQYQHCLVEQRAGASGAAPGRPRLTASHLIYSQAATPKPPPSYAAAPKVPLLLWCQTCS